MTLGTNGVYLLVQLNSLKVISLKKCHVALAAVIVMLLSSTIASGDTESISKNLTLKHFDIAYTFPKTTRPGDSIMISASAVAKSQIRIVDLSVQVLVYMESGDLQSIGSTSLAKDQYVSTGERFSKDLMVTIPANTPRSELATIFSETTSPSYSYYSYYYPSYYYYYGHAYWYYPYYYSYYYPQTASEPYVESKVLPCSYVLAATPEYIALKTDYDKLFNQYNDISAKYNDISLKYQQATGQNRQLTEQLGLALQDANNTRMLVYLFAATTVTLALFSGFLLLRRRHGGAPQNAPASAPGASQTAKPKEDQTTA